MTRNYTQTRYNRETKQLEDVANWSFSVYPGDNDHFTVCKDGIVKTIKVKSDWDFTYKLQKTQVKARDGASGLFKFVDWALSEKIMERNAWQVLDWCFDTCKAA